MEKDIGKIKKNDTTDIVIRIDDFGGRKGLTVREFVTSPKYTGFTKAGVRIPVAGFDEFKKMIDSIDKEDLKEESSPSDAGHEENKEMPKEQKTFEEEIIDY